MALFLFYLALWIVPHRYFHRRPAAVGYAAFWTVYRPVYLIILLLIYLERDAGYCMYIVLIEIMFGVALYVYIPLDVYIYIYISNIFLVKT